jgi:tight adherence protein B
MTNPILAVIVAVSGCYLLFSSFALGRKQLFVGTRTTKSRLSPSDWLTQAGMIDVRPIEFVVVEIVVFAASAALFWLIFGGVFTALLGGLFCSAAPIATYRSRRNILREAARDSWPTLLEEIRLRAGAVGRSIPVATLEAGRKAPTAPMREAFETANREWLLTTDFARATNVLKRHLADATADAVCETLLVAHELGGNDLEARLAALIDDRRTDLRHRQEAKSRQAGVRFARWFVLIMPLAMALVGLGIGDGRGAYASPSGQIGVAISIALTAACWMWAGRIMRVPSEKRVFQP